MCGLSRNVLALNIGIQYMQLRTFRGWKACFYRNQTQQGENLNLWGINERDYTLYTQVCTVIYILGTYTVKKGKRFSCPRNYSRPGRVWLVTYPAGRGKSLTFFYSVQPRFASFNSTLFDNVSYKITQLHTLKGLISSTVAEFALKAS